MLDTVLFSLRLGFVPPGFTSKTISDGHGSVINDSLITVNDHTFTDE